MYEADDYADGGATALDIGLGDSTAEAAANERKQELSLSLEERLLRKSEDARIFGETRRLHVSGQGAVREATFVPRGSAKKKAVLAAREKERHDGKDDRTGRSRRGVRELGFKTPFKHHQ